MKKLFIFLVSLLIIIPAVSFAADKVIVFAASSTTNMIDEVLAVYNKKTYHLSIYPQLIKEGIYMPLYKNYVNIMEALHYFLFQIH